MIQTLIQRTISRKWRFNQSGQALAYLADGLRKISEMFGEGMDDERTVDYIVYQIYRCRMAIAEDTWKYNWLFSASAMEKYRKQFMSEDGKSGMNYYIDQWLDKAGLSRGSLTAMIAKPRESPLKKMVYMPSEEPVKRRFLNTPDGIELCQNFTTGWSPLSEACGECDNWQECGKLTAKKYPELMRYRKEVYYGNKEK